METKNPYAPPKAAVEDVSSGEQPPRPPQVTRAVQVLWAAVAVSFVSGILNAYLTVMPEAGQPLSLGFMLVGWVIGFAIIWWILSSIAKGKNWARIVQLVFFVLGILGVLMVFSMPQQVPVIVWVLYAVQMGLNLYGIILLFGGASNAWFREMKEWV